jgi:hypothetical protein
MRPVEAVSVVEVFLLRQLLIEIHVVGVHQQLIELFLVRAV